MTKHVGGVGKALGLLLLMSCSVDERDPGLTSAPVASPTSSDEVSRVPAPSPGAAPASEYPSTNRPAPELPTEQTPRTTSQSQSAAAADAGTSAEPNECTDAACEAECAPGETRCATTRPQLCDASGTWVDQGPCPFVCVASGACGGVCVPGARRCVSNTNIDRCSAAGTWEPEGSCGPCEQCAGDGQCSALPNDCGGLACGESPSGCHECGGCPAGGFCAAGACGCTPRIVRSTEMPALPSDLKVTCMLNGEELTSSPDCPVVVCDDVTYFALSYIDNRVALAIVGFDGNGLQVSRDDLTGARYVFDIDVSLDGGDITFWGQGNSTVVMPIQDLWQ